MAPWPDSHEKGSETKAPHNHHVFPFTCQINYASPAAEMAAPSEAAATRCSFMPWQRNLFFHLHPELACHIYRSQLLSCPQHATAPRLQRSSSPLMPEDSLTTCRPRSRWREAVHSMLWSSSYLSWLKLRSSLLANCPYVSPRNPGISVQSCPMNEILKLKTRNNNGKITCKYCTISKYYITVVLIQSEWMAHMAAAVTQTWCFIVNKARCQCPLPYYLYSKDFT